MQCNAPEKGGGGYDWPTNKKKYNKEFQNIVLNSLKLNVTWKHPYMIMNMVILKMYFFAIFSLYPFLAPNHYHPQPEGVK